MKTSELTGAALDWAVAKCEGVNITFGEHGPSGQWEMYSTNWAQGGPIIERENIALYPHGDGSYEAEVFLNPLRKHGPTPLIAAMRCYVAFVLGDNVELPEELL